MLIRLAAALAIILMVAGSTVAVLYLGHQSWCRGAGGIPQTINGMPMCVAPGPAKEFWSA